jgi:hypothetical protein
MTEEPKNRRTDALKNPILFQELTCPVKTALAFCVREDGTPAGVAGNMRQSHRSLVPSPWSLVSGPPRPGGVERESRTGPEGA